MPTHHVALWLVTLLYCATGVPGRAFAADALPKIQVENIRRGFHDGHHNAFTDLCRYQGHFYLALRSCPDGHGVHPTSSILVLRSEDAQDWEIAHRFSVPLRDVRDPHFLVFQDKLFVYSGAWFCGETSPKSYEINEHLGFAAWTENGSDWQSPVMLEGTYGHYIWRAAAHDGKAYLCGRRKHHFRPSASRQERDTLIESALLESDDGIVWKKCGLFQETFGDETAFLFEPDGQILAVARSGGGRNAQICRSRPPYDSFSRTDLDRYIGGPLLVRWNDHYLVGGRKSIDKKPVTSFYWLTGDTLHEVATLPSGGDNSYPGFVPLGPNRALVSYYSSHEKDEQGRTITAVYLAEFVLKP